MNNIILKINIYFYVENKRIHNFLPSVFEVELKYYSELEICFAYFPNYANTIYYTLYFLFVSN